MSKEKIKFMSIADAAIYTAKNGKVKGAKVTKDTSFLLFELSDCLVMFAINRETKAPRSMRTNRKEDLQQCYGDFVFDFDKDMGQLFLNTHLNPILNQC